MEIGKIPPNDIEAEQAVLGSMLTDKDAVTSAIEVLKAEDYIYTSLETPIFTIRTDKYENLTKKLSEKGMIAENCGYFINLDNH